MDTAASPAAETGEPEAGANPANAQPVSADANQETVSATSPETNQDAKPASIFDAVKAALKPEKAAEDTSASSAESESKAKPADGADAPKEGSAADDEPPPFHKHPAWQRRLAKERDLTGQIEAMKPKAERFDAMQNMMVQADLTPEEVTAGFNIMALMKSDPVKALEALRPFVDALEQFSGVKLPEDLAAQVESGEMTEAAAREMAKLRSQAAVADSRARRSEETRTQEHQRNLGTAMVNAVARWESEWQSSDPDYAKKLPLVMAQIKAFRSERGAPKTLEEAVAMAKEARTAVETSLRAVVPVKPPVKPNTKDTSVNAQAKPTSLLQAVKQAAGMAA